MVGHRGSLGQPLEVLLEQLARVVAVLVHVQEGDHTALRGVSGRPLVVLGLVRPSQPCSS